MYAYVAQQQYIEDGRGRFFAFSLLIVSVILEIFTGILIFEVVPPTIYLKI